MFRSKLRSSLTELNLELRRNYANSYQARQKQNYVSVYYVSS